MLACCRICCCCCGTKADGGPCQAGVGHACPRGHLWQGMACAVVVPEGPATADAAGMAHAVVCLHLLDLHACHRVRAAGTCCQVVVVVALSY